MADSPHVVNVTAQNFAETVLATSQSKPVLVDFWADWCSPCQMLMPVLAKLVEEYQGAFLLAKVNTEEESELAGDFGSRRLPTVPPVTPLPPSISWAVSAIRAVAS